MVILLDAWPAFAEPFSIDWHTVDGGGVSSGGFSMVGTVGQPDASQPMTNGTFAVTGGFWALPIAVQVAGGPVLNIVPAATGFATVSWVPATECFVLQENLDLHTTNWINSASGPTNPVTVKIRAPAKFYRLSKP